MNDPPIAAAEATELEDRKGGFPHSEIVGSKGASASPTLIAACHVLHRLSTPRHPSEALQRLIVSQQNSCAGYSADWKVAGRPTPDFCQTMSSLSNTTYKPRGAGRILPSRFQCRRPYRPGQSLYAICEDPGGARRSRTDDILLAKQALYQLSYGPIRDLARRAVGDRRTPE